MRGEHAYDVIVGNIGYCTRGCRSFRVARATFMEYVGYSKLDHGRCAGEPVTLQRDGEPIREYVPRELVTVTLNAGVHGRRYFEYRYTVADVGECAFTTLAEVGAPWQAEARRERNRIAKGRLVRTRDNLPPPVHVADCLEPAAITREYRIITYDVWGNAEDGWQVNDSYRHGTVHIRCRRNVANPGTVHEFATYEPTDLQLSRAAAVSGVEWEYSEGDYYATRIRDGKPMGELRLERRT